ncbi:MAG: RNA 2',3'-cyclic phosphodiesterase [Actinomycetota bacterium]|nr:RNA 2',3'-cyclic phosphodiesterase [Actinomycetota bacterium]
MRLFAAVRPPDAALDHLESALVSVGWPGTGPAAPGAVRWTARENWHVTLAFFGEVPDGAVDDLAGALTTLAASSRAPQLELRGSGVFAGRTLWIGTGGEVSALVALSHGARDAGLEVLGRAEERERVRPHLTVGRQIPGPRVRRRGARERGEADAVAHALAVYRGPGWSAEELVLVRSEPGRGAGGGPLYSDLAAIPVDPAGGAVPR